MGLIITVPLAWVLGSFIGWLWAWFTVRVQSSRILTAGYRYSGEKRELNRAFNWIFPPAFWILVGFGLFELFTRTGA